LLKEGKLASEATHKKFLSVRLEGTREVKRLLDYYNLDDVTWNVKNSNQKTHPVGQKKPNA